MALRYLVITSVDRDDLPDGGADHFRRVVQELTAAYPELMIELLTPDFGGDQASLDVVCNSGAHVLGHNMETVRRMTREVRDARCDYDTSLGVLASYRKFNSKLLVKSSLLLGIGEEEAEIVDTLKDLRNVGVDWVTFGQYLRPTRKHAEVHRYLPPEEFESLAEKARALGFPLVTAGPLVRSSYRAGEQDAQSLYSSRG
jgi:lipoic acid synthetase